MKLTRKFNSKLWLADQAFIALLILIGIAVVTVLTGKPVTVTLTALGLVAIAGFVMWQEWRNA